MSAEQRPLLSICIPTFNRAQLLKEALKSILAQIDPVSADQVEIVISDNASTDETAAVVDQIRGGSGWPIKYFKNEQNFGFDANCLLAAERASGQYLWLFGSDDLLAAGALRNVIQELKGPDQADLYLGEKEDFYSVPEKPMRFRRIMKYPNGMVFDFKLKKRVDDYFRTNKKLIAYCNYLSNIVFSRNRWLLVKDKENFIGTGYVHVYVFQSMLWGNEPGVMKYLPVPLVKRRWGTDGPPELAGDEELSKSEARMKMDVQMFRRIASKVFADKKYIWLIDDLVIRNDGFSWAVRLKLHDRKRFIEEALPFLFRSYWNHPLFWLKIVPLVFLPNLLLMFMRGSYRKLIKGEPINLNEMLENKS